MTRAGYNAEDVNHVSGGVPLPVQGRPTPTGPKATGRPRPTAGVPLGMTSMGASSTVYPTGAPSFMEDLPPRQAHPSTEEIDNRPLYQQHADYFTDLEQLAKAGQLEQSPSPEVRRMLAAARKGDVRAHDYLAGVVAGFRAGLRKGAEIERTQAKQRAAGASVTRNTRNSASPAAPRAVTSHVPPVAQPSNPSAERTRAAQQVRLQQIVGEQRAAEAIAPRVAQALYGVHDPR